MKSKQKNVKAIIVWCVLLSICLIIVSVALAININLSKKQLTEQQKQITQLEQTINNLNNPPSNNDQTIIPGGN